MYLKKTTSFFIITTIAASLFFNFYIINSEAAPYIEVQTPSSGDIVYMGGYQDISWYSEDLESNFIKIELYKGGTQQQIIDSYDSNDGYYGFWYVSNSLVEDDDYRIKITDFYNSSVYGFSEYFSINVRRTITVTSPSSYSTWYKSDYNYIRWNSENAGSFVDISLLKNGVLERTISSYTANDGSYYWMVPDDLELDDDYQIKISSLSYSNVYDTSADFTIDERTLTVSKPEHGSVWYKEQEYTIEWSSRNAGNNVRIELYEDDNYKSTIESYETNDGSYSWLISSSLSKDSIYKIKISSTSYSSVYDISGSFSVNERILSFITDFSGKTWFSNETHDIEWSSENAGGYVDLILYKDDIYCGTVANDIANTGSYTWIISKEYTPSDGYHMMIKSNQYDSIKDESGKFSIGGREIEIQDLKKNQVLYIGDDFEIKWDANNAGEYLDIVLYKNDEELFTIASKVDGSEGSYTWVIPKNLTDGSGYQIKIESSSFSSVSGFSEKFSIEQTLMDKISTPLMIIVGTVVVIVCSVGLISFFRNRKNKNRKEVETADVSYKTYHQTGIIKNDDSQKEYDEIWEKRNF